MSLIRKPVIQANSDARFSTSTLQGVTPSFLISSISRKLIYGSSQSMNELFSDAEAVEDGLEDLGGGYGAGDCGEGVDGLAEVLGEEVGGEAEVYAVDQLGEGVGGFGEGGVVAGVGHNHAFVVGKSCGGCGENGVAQVAYASTGEG